MAITEIQNLASVIAYNTAIYNHYLETNNLATPSHHAFPPEKPAKLPFEIEEARQAALEASHELHELLSGPIGHILNAAARSTRIMTLQFLKTYNVGENLGWGEKATFGEIAKECGLDEDDTKRMLRLAMAEHFFTETPDGKVMHTASSFELVRNKLLSAWVGVTTQENWAPMLKITEAIGKYPGSEEPLESAYAMAHDLKDDAFKVWESDPARIKQFSDAMAFLHSDSGFKHSDVLSNLSFSEKSTTKPVFVDVGGSTGHVSIGLARVNPNIKFIVQDSEKTVARGNEGLPEDVKEQVEFQVHDFWTEQPVKNADVYFFKTIFHDWSDAYSVKILRQLIPALKKGARVIIADVCIPPKGVVSLYKEQWIRGLDIVMKCFTNAREREFGDWAALFTKADARFRFLGVRTPPGSKASIIEAEWTVDAADMGNGASEAEGSLVTLTEDDVEKKSVSVQRDDAVKGTAVAREDEVAQTEPMTKDLAYDNSTPAPNERGETNKSAPRVIDNTKEKPITEENTVTTGTEAPLESGR